MFFLHEKDSKTKSHPVRLQSLGVFTALTPALAGPQVDALGIEFHEEHVTDAPVAVPIQGAKRFASHPGAAIRIHLRVLMSWALQCAADAHGNWREKPIRWEKIK